MNVILLLTIFTTVSAVSFPARIKQIGSFSSPKNDYIALKSSTIETLQETTRDLGLTVSYNLTQGDGQLVASEGPEFGCDKNVTTQFGSMASILSTAINTPKPHCPQPKGVRKLSRKFDLDLIFDGMPMPSRDSNFTISLDVDAPDVEVPILEGSFQIFPICDDDCSSD